jgi:hypothetical protein
MNDPERNCDFHEKVEKNKSGGKAPHSKEVLYLECGVFPPLLFPLFEIFDRSTKREQRPNGLIR